MRFIEYLEESISQTKLQHISHLEDLPIEHGAEGHKLAVKILKSKSTSHISTKVDGSPSVVFGHHPENGKFFVSTKSAFNKTPKINYTEEDVDRNHGHAPGLVEKLKTGLKHLPKITPKGHIYQGDFLYSKEAGDVKTENGKHHFQPNTIKYSISTSHPEGKKVDKAKMGIAVHTKYEGSTFPDMKTVPGAKIETRFHPDVHVVSMNPSVSDSRPDVSKHLDAAESSHKEQGRYKHIDDKIRPHILTYINKTVREGTKPSVSGLRTHVRAQAVKHKKVDGPGLVAHIDQHKEAFQHTFKQHAALQKAKNAIVGQMSKETEYGHSIGDKPAKPEGFVSSLGGAPVKLVDRAEFSRSNFLKSASPK